MEASQQGLVGYDQAVRAHLDELCRSKPFAKFANGTKMLRYLVENRRDEQALKDSVVLPAVFGIRGNVDRANARVTAKTIRERLRLYYEGEGSQSRLMISLPLGSYRVKIEHREFLSGRAMALLQAAKARRDQRTPESVRQAIAALNAAEAEAPDSAEIPAWRAEVRVMATVIGFPSQWAEIRKDAEGALAKNPGLWMAHVALGAYLATVEHKWSEARRCFARAVELNPEAAQPHPWHAAFLISQGEADVAAQYLVEDARRNSISTPSGWALLGGALMLAGRLADAAETLCSAAQLYPKHWLIAVHYSMLLHARGQLDAAINALRGAGIGPESGIFGLGLLGCLEGELGHAEEARRCYESLLSGRNVGAPVPASQLITGALGVGDLAAAVRWAEASVAECDPLFLWLDVLPVTAPIRKVPSYVSLMTRIGLRSEGSAASA